MQSERLVDGKVEYLRRIYTIVILEGVMVLVLGLRCKITITNLNVMVNLRL